MRNWAWALVAGLMAGAVIAVAPVVGASAEDNNRGDVWVDTPGNIHDPGHENDPHLCAPIDIYGAGLADGSGTFTIDSWPPTGQRVQAFPASGSAKWSYDQASGGVQVIAGPINLPAGHYKLELSQDPHKHKVFWIDCSSSNPTPHPSSSPPVCENSPCVTPSPSPPRSPSPSPSSSPHAPPAAGPPPPANLGPAAPLAGTGSTWVATAMLGLLMLASGAATIAFRRRGLN